MSSRESRANNNRLFLRKIFFIGICFSLFILLLTWSVQVTSAQGDLAYELIDEVNAIRVANGLVPYRIDGSLMNAAQVHSEYQASIGSVTHTGAGGSRPRDRARAAGYGGGLTIFVTENIAGGANLSVKRVVQMWQADGQHLNTMTGVNYRDIGAGVATSGNMTYFTIDVGYIAGQGGGSQDITPNPSVGFPKPTGTPAQLAANSSVLLSSIREDGSIVHVVESGQMLYPIAEAYDVDIQEILSLNNLSIDSIIRPGDEIIIKLADITPTATATAEKPNPSSSPKNYTMSEKQIGQVIPTTVLQSQFQEIQVSPTVDEFEIQPEQPIDAKSIIIIIAVLISLGTALTVIYWTLKRGG